MSDKQNPGISRRDFLKIIFGSVPAAALVGTLPVPWPAEAMERPVAEPYRLALQYGYIIDPNFDYEGVVMPTHGERLLDHHGFVWKREASARAALAELHMSRDAYVPVLEEIEDIENLDDTHDAEIERWLAEKLDFEELSPFEGAEMSEYAPGIEIYQRMALGLSRRLGLHLVQGDHPGSDFTGVRFSGELAELNMALAREGLNMVVEQEQSS